MNNYTTYCKPTLSKALKSVGLDKEYFKASGNYLYYRNDHGEEVQVLDLLGGYGATLIGHFHPEIGARYKRYLDEQIPFHNQFSIRRASGDLSALLNKRLRQETGYKDDFQFCYTSTGAETMEIALKHAEYARNQELQAHRSELEKVFGTINAGADYLLTSDQQKLLGLSSQASPQEIKKAVIHYNEEQINTRPIFIALEHAFHGKMMLTANCTHHPMYRDFLRCLKVDTLFLSAHSLHEMVSNHELQQVLWGMVLKPKIINGVVHLSPVNVRRVMAILAEPVQGEGGVRTLTPSIVHDLNTLRYMLQSPLIADEVQSGSGRCGFLVAAADIGLDADYYVLSKALGAGYVKIGVIAIKKSQFATGFDLIQSSTFGEDDLSCRVAHDYLELLFTSDEPLINRVHKLSNQLGHVLSRLQRDFPDVVKDVRYKGLLLGIEFQDIESSPSYLLQNIAAQGSLGYIIAGHLLNASHIRVAPSSSSTNVLRFEPSLYLEQRHISLLQSSLEKICLAIRYADAGYLLKPIIKGGVSSVIQPKDYRTAVHTVSDFTTAADYKVTFINHLISAAGLRDIESSFEIFTDKEIEDFLINASFNLSTIPFAPTRIRGGNGKTVDFIIHPIPVTSQMVASALEKNDLTRLRDEVNNRVNYAVENGSHSVGLGMFTSIITNNGKSIDNNSISITTGNALTAGMGISAVKEAFNSRRLADAVLSVIGAAGNIGSIYAEILGADCKTLLLVGSNKQDSLLRLNSIKHKIYTHYYELISENKKYTEGSMASRLQSLMAGMPKQLHQQCHSSNAGMVIDSYLTASYPGEKFISVSQNILDVVDSDIIVCATNATNTILPISQLKKSAVICDIAVPHNVQKEVLAIRPDLQLLRGGIVKMPNDDALDSRVRAYLSRNQLYACMAETVLLALEEYPDHFSYGNISTTQVSEIMGIASKHGFTLADAKKESSL